MERNRLFIRTVIGQKEKEQNRLQGDECYRASDIMGPDSVRLCAPPVPPLLLLLSIRAHKLRWLQGHSDSPQGPIRSLQGFLVSVSTL